MSLTSRGMLGWLLDIFAYISSCVLFGAVVSGHFAIFLLEASCGALE
jgi:hypothetical protein